MDIKKFIKSKSEDVVTFLQNNKMGRRALSLVLALTVVAGSLVALSTFATEEEAYILNDGQIIEEITVQEDEEKEISVSYDAQVDGYQWEVYASEQKVWVSVSGQTQDTIKLSYALLGAVLNQQGKTQIRCRLDGNKTVYSPVVNVNVSYNYEENETLTLTDNSEEKLYNGPLGSGSTPAGKASVIIYFNFESGALASPSFKTVVELGTDVIVSQSIPTITGYIPYLTKMDGVDYNDNLGSTMVVDINYPAIAGDKSIYITYKPEFVNYQVRFNLQNIYDDLYTEDLGKRLTLTGKADSTVEFSTIETAAATELAALTGFTMLYFDPVEIASDGSTIINLYFDRNYYLMYFILGEDGYGVEPLYARYDAVVSTNTPKRHGYSFAGWSPALELKMPVGNSNYTATWTAVNTTYTVVYWRENADDDKYSYWGSEQKNATSATYVSGPTTLPASITDSDKAYFTFDHADQNVLVEGDATTIVNVYFKRNRYTIEFSDSSATKCLLQEHTHTNGDHCEVLTCGNATHNHTTSGCTLICGKTAHTHSVATCGITNCTHKEHDLSCYTTQSLTAIADFSKSTGASVILDTYKTLTSGTVYRYRENKNTYKNYFYLNGLWYDLGNVARNNYTNTTIGGITVGSGLRCDEKNAVSMTAIISCNHTHSEACYDCGLSAHTHTDACYQCVQTAHTHTAECYSNYCCGNTDSSHVHSAECIYAEHTHSTTNCKSSTTDHYFVKKVIAKYGQDISSIWPVVSGDGSKTYNSGERWKPRNSKTYSLVLVFIAKMPAENLILDCDRSDYSTKTMNYYVQVLPGDTGFEKNGVTYYNETKYTIKANYNYITEAEDYFDIVGFTKKEHDGTFGWVNDGKVSTTINMYYTRNQYTVTYHSADTTVKSEKYYFEQQIDGAGTFVPDYPSTFEPNAYQFAGWYSTEKCLPGTEVDATTQMPAHDVLLYAKWEPKTHYVKAYPSYNDMLTKSNQIGETQEVAHRDYASEPTHPSKPEWFFAGWFYMDGDTKKPFIFNNMEVRTDYDVFAEWTSTKTTEYTIRYVEYETDGTEREIAPEINAKTLVGQTKHFYAKTGNEVYSQYKYDWYPITGSTSMMIEEDPTKNVYVFEYMHLTHIEYKVNYLDAVTKQPVKPSQTFGIDAPHEAKVTASAPWISGYMPDSLRKSLVLSAIDPEGTKNVINFYYSEDTTHTLFRIVHHVQKLSATDKTNPNLVNDVNSYEVYEEPYEYIVSHDPADIKKVADSVISITGFTFYPAMTLVNNVKQTDPNYQATVTPEGLIIDLYYTRNYYDYKVGYYDYEDNTSLKPEETKSAPYGATVTETAATIDKCKLVSANSSKSITITNHTPDATHNSIFFYYIAYEYVVNYITVAPDGTVDTDATDSMELDINIETLKKSDVLAGKKPGGSTPIDNDEYEFTAWYTDAACTIPVDSSLVDPVTNKLTPTAEEDSTYYAKFRFAREDLVIKVDGDVDSDDMFYYHVVGLTEKNGGAIALDTIVAIKGKGSATIKKAIVGSYTITPIDMGNLKYNLDSQKFNGVAFTTSFDLIPKVEKNATDKNEVVMTYSKITTPPEWSTGFGRVLNIFGEN